MPAPPLPKPRRSISPAVDALLGPPGLGPDYVPDNPKLAFDLGAGQFTNDPRVLQSISRDNPRYHYDPISKSLGQYVPDTSLVHAVSGRDDSHYESLDPGFQQLLTDQKLDRDSYPNQLLPPRDPFPQSRWAKPRRPGEHRLGDLSMWEETHHRPGQEDLASATISSGIINGRPDPGGKSYGPFQLKSIPGAEEPDGQVQLFLRSPQGRRWSPYFDGFTPSIPGRTGPYENTWQFLAMRYPAFFDDQHAYIDVTDYQPVVKALRSHAHLDVHRQSDIFQDAVWSLAVQHGGGGPAQRLAVDAINSVQTPRNSPDFERDAIKALYAARAAKSPSNKARYARELQAALTRLDGGPFPEPFPPPPKR